MRVRRGGAGRAALLFSCRYEDVVAGRAKALHGGELGEPARRATPGEDRNDLDGFGNERSGHGHDGFLDELLEATERTYGRARVQGADAARMPGAPSLQEVQRLRAAHLADRDAI